MANKEWSYYDLPPIPLLAPSRPGAAWSDLSRRAVPGLPGDSAPRGTEPRREGLM